MEKCTSSVCLYFIFILLLTASKSEDADGNPETLDEKIVLKLKKLRKTAPYGNPARNVPIFDPYKIADANFYFNRYFINLMASFSNMTLTGVRDLQINNIETHFLPTELVFNITIPKLIFRIGQLKYASNIFNKFKTYGNGFLGLQLSKFNLAGNLRVSLREKFIKITDVILKGGFSKFDFLITRFKFPIIEKFLSLAISWILPKIYGLYKKAFWNALGRNIHQKLILLFKNTTIKQILNVLDSQDDGFLPL